MKSRLLVGVLGITALAACGPASITLDVTEGKPGSDPDVSDTGSATDPDPDSDPDPDPDPDPEPEPFQWAGEYEGTVEVYLWGNGWNICENDDNVSFEIDADGVVVGNGYCESWPDGYSLVFSGTADSEGRISGQLDTEVYIDASGSKEPYTFDFLGVVNDEGVSVTWDSAIPFDYWEMKVDGAAWAN